MSFNRILLRRDTFNQWTSANPILQSGEMAVEIDTNRLKVGDGFTFYVDLPYIVGSGGGGSTIVGSYIHEQSVPNNVWTVNHNLGVQYLAVEVIDNTGNSLVGSYNYPEINFASNTELTATFTSSVSGWLVANSGGGVQGPAGVPGFTGSVGFTGSQGSQGATGFTGSVGAIGFTGSTGNYPDIASLPDLPAI